MNRTSRVVVIILLAVGITALVIAKQRSRSAPVPSAATTALAGLPRLVDLGSDVCVACQLQAPVLEELARETNGRLFVEVIDVQKDRQAAAAYRISVIPTQIFFDATGNEVFRHEGFMSKDDILAKWKEFGVDLSSTASALASN